MADCLQIDRLMRQSGSQGMTYKGIDYLWSQDLQGGGYGGITQLQYDTQSVSNSGQFIVWSQAFLSIPYTITLQSNTTGASLGSDTAAAVTWKSGFWNLVDSLQISCNNKTVNNLCNKTNMAQTVRAVLNADIDKGQTSLPTYGFTLDTAESASVQGTGPAFNTWQPSNNRISYALGGQTNNQPPTASGVYTTLFPSVNQGLIERCKTLNFEPDGVLLQQTNVTSVLRAFSSHGTNSQQVSGVAIIPLKYLSDFFSEQNLGMPLRNLRMYLQVNVNVGSVTFTVGGSAPNYNTSTLTSTFPFQTVPIIVTDAGCSAIQSGNSATATLAIGSYNGSTFPTRIYYPTVQLEDSVLAKLSFPLKKMVTYRDIQFFTLTNVAANTSFNWQISNAIPGLKRVFILPLIAAANSIGGKPSWSQPFSSVPGTGDPNMCLSNISLQINTRQLWSNNILFDFEAYIEQILPNRLNGDTSEFIAGSLVSQQKWLAAYRWYVFDCSKVPSLLNVTANTPVNLQLLATNNTYTPVDLFCWAEVETDVVLETTPISTFVA